MPLIMPTLRSFKQANQVLITAGPKPQELACTQPTKHRAPMGGHCGDSSRAAKELHPTTPGPVMASLTESVLGIPHQSLLLLFWGLQAHLELCTLCTLLSVPLVRKLTVTCPWYQAPPGKERNDTFWELHCPLQKPKMSTSAGKGTAWPQDSFNISEE